MKIRKHQALLLYLLILSAFSIGLSINMKINHTTGLNSDWTLKNSNGSISLKNLTIPLSVHNALLDAKLIDDPLYRYNDINLRWIVYEPSWIFTKYFEIDKTNNSQVFLQFNSIDTISDIYLNDKLILTTQNQFLKYRTDDVNAYLNNGTNKLEIKFQSPVLYANVSANKYNYSLPVECPQPVQHGECHVNFLRKEQCSFSWDWGPAFAPIGINDKIILKIIDNFDFEYSISVYPLIKGNLSDWVIDLKLDFQLNTVNNVNNDLNNTIEFSISKLRYLFNDNLKLPNQTNFSINYKLNISTNSHSIDLWYPRDYGYQFIYDFKLKAVIFGKNMNKNGTVAFRSVELVQEKIENVKGLTFYFKINNQPVFLKGSNWIPMNVFKDRLDKHYLRWLLQSVYDGNMNVLRIWGGGVYETEDFYNLADEFGIMIWQDFMFASASYPTNPEYLVNVENEVEYQLNRLRHHPSLLAWSGNNENEGFVGGWIGTDLHKNDYRKLYIDTIRRKVSEIDPDQSRPFVPSSPSNGIESEMQNWISDNPSDSLYGDVHFYNNDADGWDSDLYPITRFLSEFGIQSLPSFSTLRTAYDEKEDMSIFSSLNSHRQHQGDGNEKIWFGILKHFDITNTTKFGDIIYFSQINQAMSLKTGIEVCRRNRDFVNKKTSEGFCMGIMYWMLNDIWQAPTWSSIEYGGRWKIAHNYITSAFANLLLSPVINRTQKTIDVYLIADKLPVSNLQNYFKFGVYKYGSFKPIYTEKVNFKINSLETHILKKISLVEIEKKTKCKFDNQKCLFIFEFGKSMANVSLGENFLFPTNEFHNAKINPIKVNDVKHLGDNKYTIRLSTTKISLFVYLDITNPDIMGHFSSNGFHMVKPTYDVIFIAMKTNFTIEKLKKALEVKSIVLS